jgi:phage terminase large subunit GpA-like protein
MDSSWGSFVVWFGYVIHQAPGPMMALSPTVELAKRNSKLGIDPLGPRRARSCGEHTAGPKRRLTKTNSSRRPKNDYGRRAVLGAERPVVSSPKP